MKKLKSVEDIKLFISQLILEENKSHSEKLNMISSYSTDAAVELLKELSDIHSEKVELLERIFNSI